jgi:hypothetical protein
MKAGAIRRRLSRALIFSAAQGPAVSLHGTAGFIPARLGRSSRTHTSSVQRRRRVESKPFIPPQLFRALIGDMLCILARASPHPSIQRRRRGGLKPGVQRSETPGNRCEKHSEPLARGGGELRLTDTVRQTANHAPAGSP